MKSNKLLIRFYDNRRHHYTDYDKSFDRIPEIAFVGDHVNDAILRCIRETHD